MGNAEQALTDEQIKAAQEVFEAWFCEGLGMDMDSEESEKIVRRMLEVALLSAQADSSVGCGKCPRDTPYGTGICAKCLLANSSAEAGHNGLLRLLQELADAAEDFISSEPGMPSHSSAEERFDAALDAARAAIAVKGEAK